MNVIILDTTDTTYAFYEIEKRKKNKNKGDKSKEKKKKRRNIGKIVVPPPQGMWRTLEKNRTQLLVKQYSIYITSM